MSLLYTELTDWYRLLDPLADHATEAELYAAQLSGETLLELGAGAGHNAFFLKDHFRCCLVDLSDPMLELSRELNPECEHLVGDMRTLRLGRTFDAVVVHDAISYLTTLEDLKKTAATVFAHLKPGGRAIVAPDTTREDFEESSDLHENDEGNRSLRCLEWFWDPDPSDSTYYAEYAFLLREGSEVRSVHDRHLVGLFSDREWRDVLEGAGFSVSTFKRLADDYEDSGFAMSAYLCQRTG
ncbi:MAG: methyltransferase domain-containing protein [Myxococcota bacterium]